LPLIMNWEKGLMGGRGGGGGGRGRGNGEKGSKGREMFGRVKVQEEQPPVEELTIKTGARGHYRNVFGGRGKELSRESDFRG